MRNIKVGFISSTYMPSSNQLIKDVIQVIWWQGVFQPSLSRFSRDLKKNGPQWYNNLRARLMNPVTQLWLSLSLDAIASPSTVPPVSAVGQWVIDSFRCEAKVFLTSNSQIVQCLTLALATFSICSVVSLIRNHSQSGRCHHTVDNTQCQTQHGVENTQDDYSVQNLCFEHSLQKRFVFVF